LLQELTESRAHYEHDLLLTDTWPARKPGNSPPAPISAGV